ncbi:hypothetical protein HXX76_001250 [Chlamydomonas incerta]|uniref:Uncharacterized protein n=1 Tax=Chlamydomonas incerta TaxID=51695 RepID=A0A836B183_CHLIN|nr:hypothetical protein HXX76_001250 [Chlamydomonas incerta]|eukprot:KAG2444502.1 hypothetical protein HXX76_001250 [Chlamydomonas incerta]
MGALVTPEYVEQLANALQASGAEKAVAFNLAASSLPEGFTSIAKEDGAVEFVGPDGRSSDHPLLANAAAALEQLRASAAGPGAGKFLGPFEDFDSPGTEFFYLDVDSGERLAEAEVPPSRIIPPLAEQLQQVLLMGPAPGETGSVTEAATEAEVEADAAGAAEGAGEGEPSDAAATAAAAAAGTGSEAVSRAASQRSAAAGSGSGDAPEPPASAGPASRSASQRSGSGLGAGAGLSGEAGSAAGAGSQAASRSASQQAASGDVTADLAGAASAGASAAVSRSASQQRSDAGGAGGPASRTASQRSAAADGAASQPASHPASQAASQAASRNASIREPGLNGSTGLRSQPSQGAASVAGSTSEAGGGGGATTAAATAAASEPRDSPSAGSPTTEAAAPPQMPPVGRTVSYAGIKVSMFAAAAGEDGGASSARGGRLTAENSRQLNTALSTKSAGLGVGPSRALSTALSSKSLALGGDPSRGALSRAMSSKSVGNTAEQQAALTGGIGVKPPVPPAGGKLTFFGWWFEDIESTDLTFRVDSKSQAGGGLAARHCRLVFDFNTQTYTFTMKDPVSPTPPGTAAPNHVPELTIRAIQPDQVLLPESGRQAAVWDLHLGSRLRVLGRVVTLKNAELATIEWHDSYCRKMAAIRDAIAQEIQKYRPRALRPGLMKDRGAPKLGGQRLRHMAGQVRELINDLRQYRPSRAANYLENMPIVFIEGHPDDADDAMTALLYGLRGTQDGDE